MTPEEQRIEVARHRSCTNAYHGSYIAKLERELAEKSEQVDSLISEVTSMKCAHVHPSIRWASKQMWNYVMGRDVSAATVAEVTHAIEAKEAELTRLREALTDAEDFARHDRGCPDYSDEGPCACGYEQWWTRKESALHPSPSKPEDV